MRCFELVFISLLFFGCSSNNPETWIVASRMHASMGFETVIKDYYVKTSEGMGWQTVDRIDGLDYTAGFEYVIKANKVVKYYVEPLMDDSDRIVYLDNVKLISKEKRESEGLDPKNLWNPTWPDSYNPWFPSYNDEEWNKLYGNWADGYDDPDPYKEY